MIKFFQKIRQGLLNENRFRKYVLYAMGEIILVVIGILFAIQLNSLNENRKEYKKEVSFLLKLKEDLQKDIKDLTEADSIMALFESRSKKALDLFHEVKTVTDLITTDSLFDTTWNNLKINRKTYDEMLSTSGIYILSDKELPNQLNDYYGLVETFQQYNREINSDSQQMWNNPDLDVHLFLVQEYSKPGFENKKIDTLWIGDFNAPTSLALYRYYNHAQRNINSFRRTMHEEIIARSKALIEEIEQELKLKNIVGE